MVTLTQYLLDSASVSRIIKKSDMQKTAKSLLKRLYPIDAEAMIVNTSEIDVTEIANSNPCSFRESDAR